MNWKFVTLEDVPQFTEYSDATDHVKQADNPTPYMLPSLFDNYWT